jgi:GcrA cell cycle regulator
VAQLRRHYSVGLTAAESALLLGGVSRSAVIAKRNRLGLVGAPPRRRADETQVSGAEKPRARYPRFRPEPPFAVWPLPDMDRPPPHDARPAALARHQRGQCLWPLGPAEAAADWRSLFCCAPTLSSRPYCAIHAERARR